MNKKLKAAIVGKCGTQFLFAILVEEHEAVVSKVIRGKLTLSPEKQRLWADVLEVEDSSTIFEPGCQG